jgi:hypothetical protein
MSVVYGISFHSAQMIFSTFVGIIFIKRQEDYSEMVRNCSGLFCFIVESISSDEIRIRTWFPRSRGRTTGVRSIPGRGKRFFSNPQRSDRFWGPPTFSQGVKRPGHVADNSSPSGAEVKNGGAIPPLPHTSLWRDA